MPEDSAKFPFDEDPDLGVFVCSKVLDQGHPILHVAHDDEGDWQFTCGGDHGEESGDEPRLVCLKHVIAREPRVAELADLCPGWGADRENSESEWERFDGMEDIVRENVDEHGLHVMRVPADEEGPAFSYTIGVHRTFNGPELICVGLPLASAHSILNHVADLMREGAVIRDGDVRTDVLEGYSCKFLLVSRAAQREYLGYATWFYEGLDYPVLQLVYPDKEGRFPNDRGASEEFRWQQPLLQPVADGE